MTLTLSEACTPRQSVFDANLVDTVHLLDALPTLSPAEFFAENFVTDGMKTLLKEVFTRIDGSNPDANGAFLLSQSMGGGKTHSLLALGLLAMYPEFRKPVMGSFANVSSTVACQVVTFNGRQVPEFGIWGHLAEQLNRREVFDRFYSPLAAPGESDWINLLQGDNFLILMDEMPPYFNQALQVSLGQSTLAHATQSALANLLSAISTGKLPNVTLVLTDLSGTAYEDIQEATFGVLSNMEKEAERTVQRISPVRLDSTEVYDILRTRIFERLPDQSQIDSIANAFRTAIEEAGRVLDVPTDRAETIQNGIRETYPFHPSMVDIFARFRENQGYQQTRALIRILRQIVAELWTSGDAEKRHLIGVHDVNPGNPRLYSELEKINNRFGNAIAHDIQKETNDAIAQTIDGANDLNAQHTARLILMSSLSLAADPVLGLNRSEVVSYLASPTRSAGSLNQAIDALIDRAWYLHATADARMLFRNTENVLARLESAVKNVTGTDVQAEITRRVASLFAPVQRDVYQEVKALPDLNDVSITQDKTTLIVARPEDVSKVNLTDYYNSLQFKNRVIFVTGRTTEYQTLELDTRHLIAATRMVNNFEQERFKPDDPQMIEARDLQTRYDSKFYMALQESFHTLRCPTRNELFTMEFQPTYSATGFSGEDVIRETLIARNQFESLEKMMDSGFRDRIERQLWPANAKEASWTQIRNEAAQNAQFPLHTPSKLEDVKAQAVMLGFWRISGDGRFVERGPFEQEKAKVTSVRPIGKQNPENGEITLEVTSAHGDQIKFIAEDGTETLVTGNKITLKELKGRFVAIDSTGKLQSADPYPWQGTILLRYDVQNDGAGRKVILEAKPEAQIRYTIDGTDPRYNGSLYTKPVDIADSAVKVIAIAEAQGVIAKEEFAIPGVTGEAKVVVDATKPATWKRTISTASTLETFTLIDQLRNHHISVNVVKLDADNGQHYASFTTDTDTISTHERVKQLADQLVQWYPSWDVIAEFSTLVFEHGSDLTAFVTERNMTIGINEVQQPA